MPLPLSESDCTRYRCNCSDSTDILGKFVCATAGYVGNLPCTNPTCQAIGCGCQYGSTTDSGGVPYTNTFSAGVNGKVNTGPGSSCCGCGSTGGGGSTGGSGSTGGGGSTQSDDSAIISHGPWGINIFGVPWWVFAAIVIIGAKAKKGA